MVDQRARVVVQSADRLSAAGLTHCMGGRSEVVLVPAERRAEADVVVVAAYGFTEEVVAGLRRAAGEAPVPVVLVLNEIGAADAVTIAECRVVAVLPRADATVDRLLRVVLAAAAGRGATPAAVVVELLEHVRRSRREVVAPTRREGWLTAREIDMLRLMAEGLDTAEIASTMCYSERTVKNVLSGITNRLNLRNRPHAVAYALRKGLI